MKKPVRSKAFIEALAHFQEDFRKMEKYFTDRRLTQSEKKILECWILLSRNEFIRIISILENLSVNHDPLVEAQKQLILGITLNARGESAQSIPLIQGAYETLLDYPIPRNQFIALKHWFNACLNHKEEEGMRHCLREMENYDLKTERQKVAYHHAQYSYHAYLGELRIAREHLLQAEEMSGAISDDLAVEHYRNWFDYFVKTGEFEKGYDVLALMKKQRKFYQTEIYNYMKLMLDHYLHYTPLYVYSTDFENHAIHYYELRVIKFLEEDDLEGASKSWAELQRFAPHIYQDEYRYLGDVTIFSLNLQKHLSHSRIRPEASSLPSLKESRLIAILESSTAPVKKETLYLQIWNHPMTHKDDTLKLRKLVSRCRKKTGFEIHYRKGCYQLLQGASSKKRIA